MGVCSVRVTRLNECMARACQPERPLADHAALTDHSVVKRTKSLLSSPPPSRHQQFGERV